MQYQYEHTLPWLPGRPLPFTVAAATEPRREPEKLVRLILQAFIRLPQLPLDCLPSMRAGLHAHRPILFCVALCLLAACGGGGDGVSPGDPSAPNGSSPDTIPLRLLGLGVTFAPYDPATGRAGDFDFRMPMPGAPLGAFGRRVSDPQGNSKSLPTYDYTLPPGTVVRAPADGVVQWVRWQEDSRDYEVQVRRSKNATWWYDFDHLSQVTVDSGASVRTGDPIGTVQTYSYNDGQRVVTYGFVELMVVNDATNLAYCPVERAYASVSDSLRNAVEQLAADWEALGNTNPDTAAIVAPGCHTHTEVP